jgi:hypothetical protein
MGDSEAYAGQMRDFGEALERHRRAVDTRQKLMDVMDSVRGELARMDGELVYMTARVQETRTQANYARHVLLYALWADTSFEDPGTPDK